MDNREKEALLCSKYNNINRLLAIQNVEQQDREDLLHEIFINAYRSLPRLRDISKMDAWLWKITRNVVNRHWRAVMVRRETICSLNDEVYTAEAEGSYYLQLARELDKIGDREELIGALRSLPEEVLILFRLHYFEGYKLTEIAQITGMSVNTVKSRHRRGIEKLREIMENSRIREEEQNKP